MCIHDSSLALTIFCQAAIKHTTATQAGDYQIGNKAHKQLIMALQWLETHQLSQLLLPFLESPQDGVRLWTTTYLLLHNHPAAEVALQSLANQPGVSSLNAELTLCEWRAGLLASLW